MFHKGRYTRPTPKCQKLNNRLPSKPVKLKSMSKPKQTYLPPLLVFLYFVVLRCHASILLTRCPLNQHHAITTSYPCATCARNHTRSSHTTSGIHDYFALRRAPSSCERSYKRKFPTSFFPAYPNATQQDPSVDFTTAVKALARCPKLANHARRLEDEDVGMRDRSPSPDTKPTHKVSKIATKCPRVSPAPNRVRMSPPSLYSRSLEQKERWEREQREISTADMREKAGTDWQQREQMALVHAYVMAFAWWPHCEASERRCHSFVQKYWP